MYVYEVNRPDHSQQVTIEHACRSYKNWHFQLRDEGVFLFFFKRIRIKHLLSRLSKIITSWSFSLLQYIFNHPNLLVNEYFAVTVQMGPPHMFHFLSIQKNLDSVTWSRPRLHFTPATHWTTALLHDTNKIPFTNHLRDHLRPNNVATGFSRAASGRTAT